MDAGSAAYISRLSGLDLVVSLRQWTVAVYGAAPNTALTDVALKETWGTGLTSLDDVPMPAGVRPDPAGDGHLSVVQPSSGCVYDLFRARSSGGSWTASSGNALGQGSTGIYPGGGGTRAAGFSAALGLVWPQEIERGRIDHALVFAYPYTRSGPPVAPADPVRWSHQHGRGAADGRAAAARPPLDLSTLGLNRAERVIAKALQEYGMVLGDTSGGFTLYAAHPRGLGYDPYAKLFGTTSDWASLAKIPKGRFQVLSLSGSALRWHRPPRAPGCADRPPSPAVRARPTLERPDDAVGDPPAVEATLLRAHHLAVDDAPVDQSGHHGHGVPDHGEAGRRVRVEPARPGRDDVTRDQVEVGGRALPLAPRGPGRGTQCSLDEGLARQVVGRGVAGLQHPPRRRRVGNPLAAQPDLDGLVARLDPRRARIVPDGLLAGCGGCGDGSGHPEFASAPAPEPPTGQEFEQPAEEPPAVSDSAEAAPQEEEVFDLSGIKTGAADTEEEFDIPVDEEPAAPPVAKREDRHVERAPAAVAPPPPTSAAPPSKPAPKPAVRAEAIPAPAAPLDDLLDFEFTRPGTAAEPAAADATEATAEEAENDELLTDQLLDVIQEVLAQTPPAPRRSSGPQPGRSALFSDFSEDELLAVMAGLRLLTFEPGDIIVTEGEPGDSLFVLSTRSRQGLREGRARPPRPGPPHRRRAPSSAKISILTGRPRTATVTAATSCELLELDRGTLDEIALEKPNVWQVLQQFYKQRTSNAEEARIRSSGASGGALSA